VNGKEPDNQEREENSTSIRPSAAEGQPFRIGDYLARQRQLRGFSLEKLEEITRIPKRSLERLEAGAFDGEDDGFARGFVRTVAQALGLDPEDTTMLMLSEPDATTRESTGFSRPFQWSLLVIVVALLATGLWLSKDAEPTATPSEPPKEVWVRHDAVRDLANQVGVRSVPSSAPLIPVRSMPQQEETAPAVPVLAPEIPLNE
jgi:cytoskeletal protein RodZ